MIYKYAPTSKCDDNKSKAMNQTYSGAYQHRVIPLSMNGSEVCPKMWFVPTIEQEIENKQT